MLRPSVQRTTPTTLHVSRMAGVTTWRLAVLGAQVWSFQGWEQAAKVDGLQGSFAPMVVKWSKGKPTPITPVAGANKRKGGPEDADQTNTQVHLLLGQCVLL